MRLDTHQARLLQQARSARSSGDLAAADQIFSKLTKQRASDPDILAEAAANKSAMQRHRAARPLIQKAISLRPVAPPAWHYTLSRTFSAEGAYDRALETIDHALGIHPGDPQLLTGKAEILALTRRNEEACGVLLPLVESGSVPPGVTALFARVARRGPHAPLALEYVRQAAEDPSLPPAIRQRAWFGVGDLLDDDDHPLEAFDAYQAANDIEDKSRYDPDEFSRLIDELIDRWTPDAFASIRPPKASASHIVFVLGMRRSGTSLTERILAAHPGVHGAGELELLRSVAEPLQPPPGNPYGLLTTPDALTSPGAPDRAARSYLNALRKITPKGAERVVDKMPANWAYIGLIGAVLPEARIVHVRRDPVDTCASCFIQAFVNNAEFCDLERVARHYNDYRRAGEHLLSLVPNPVLELRYEDLVSDQETQTRRLIDFTGLPWDGACLRFEDSEAVTLTASHAQVTRSLYADSVGRASRYADRLDPLRAALKPEKPKHNTKIQP